jgi:hypothetical protein
MRGSEGASINGGLDDFERVGKTGKAFRMADEKVTARHQATA